MNKTLQLNRFTFKLTLRLAFVRFLDADRNFGSQTISNEANLEKFVNKRLIMKLV